MVVRIRSLLLLLLFVLPLQAWGASIAGTVSVVRGEVVSKRPGQEQPIKLRAGSRVLVGDLITTASGGHCQLLLQDDSAVNLAPDTSVRVSQFALDTAENRRSAVVTVVSGRARVVVRKERQRDSVFRVQTPHALASVVLADVVAEVGSDRTVIAVLDGSATVSNKSSFVVGEVVLSDNQATEVKEKAPPAVPHVISVDQRRLYKKDARNQ